MIKALIIVHLWSLIVAGGAWALQRDVDGRIGARFPAPNIWLALIALCLLPGVLCLMPLGGAISLPQAEIFAMIQAQTGDSSGGSGGFNYLAIYLGLSLLLIIRTTWRWSCLQRVPLRPTAEPGVYTTIADIPPLTLSWPRRAVAVPHGFETQAALIQHERAHLRHNDAELTLLLLLLQDFMLRNPAVSYLVRQWRLSIELRADTAATRNLTAAQRKEYASLLLNIQRPDRRLGGALPCPTARLNSTPHRHAKMRLIGIIEGEPGGKKRRWGAALLGLSVCASGLGLTSALASASTSVIDMASSPIDYVTRTPLQMPATCPGLIQDIKARGVQFEEKEVSRDGELVSLYTINLGTVILSHDVRRDGSIHKPRVLDSTLPCFEANAKAAITEWMAAPQEFAIKDAAVKLHFVMSATTKEGLNDRVKSYLP